MPVEGSVLDRQDTDLSTVKRLPTPRYGIPKYWLPHARDNGFPQTERVSTTSTQKPPDLETRMFLDVDPKSVGYTHPLSSWRRVRVRGSYRGPQQPTPMVLGIVVAGRGWHRGLAQRNDGIRSGACESLRTLPASVTLNKYLHHLKIVATDSPENQLVSARNEWLVCKSIDKQGWYRGSCAWDGRLAIFTSHPWKAVQEGQVEVTQE